MKHVIPAAIVLSLAAIVLSLAAVGFATAQTSNPGATTGAPTGATTGTTRPAPATTGTTPGSTAGTTTTAPTGAALGNRATGAPADSSNAAVNTSNDASRNTHAPVPGANSFTEGEARRRIQDKGFGEVTSLKKDDQGIWRGTATKDGKSANVALDYQGNVVGQ
ncbi:MAG: hypothetical protein NVSMB18_25030 [Acetobacteraceae bacterium]